MRSAACRAQVTLQRSVESGSRGSVTAGRQHLLQEGWKPGMQLSAQALRSPVQAEERVARGLAAQLQRMARRAWQGRGWGKAQPTMLPPPHTLSDARCPAPWMRCRSPPRRLAAGGCRPATHDAWVRWALLAAFFLKPRQAAEPWSKGRGHSQSSDAVPAGGSGWWQRAASCGSGSPPVVRRGAGRGGRRMADLKAELNAERSVQVVRSGGLGLKLTSLDFCPFVWRRAAAASCGGAGAAAASDSPTQVPATARSALIAKHKVEGRMIACKRAAGSLRAHERVADWPMPVVRDSWRPAGNTVERRRRGRVGEEVTRGQQVPAATVGEPISNWACNGLQVVWRRLIKVCCVCEHAKRFPQGGGLLPPPPRSFPSPLTRLPSCPRGLFPLLVQGGSHGTCTLAACKLLAHSQAQDS